MTGLLVIGTIAVVAFILVLLGAPGLFRPLVTYKIYFDNAAGIKQGAPVMLAGRKIGQVQKLFSPVSPKEEKSAQEAAAAIHPPQPDASSPAVASAKAGPTPAENKPRFEVRVGRGPKAPDAPKTARCSLANARPIWATPQLRCWKSSSQLRPRPPTR